MIQIEWLHDEHECETCGYAYAEGARVHIMRNAAWDHLFTLEPHAFCYDGDHWDRDKIYLEILKTLGHEIVEVDNP